MSLVKQITEEVRDRLKTEKIKGYTLLDTKVGVSLVYNGFKAALQMQYRDFRQDGLVHPDTIRNDIWELVLSDSYTVAVRVLFSVYTIDLDSVINEMIEWVVFGNDKVVFEFGPTIRGKPWFQRDHE